MTFFIKLNTVSFFYGFIFFLTTELFINVYRVGRITGIDLDTVQLFIVIINVLLFCLVGFGAYIFHRSYWKGSSKHKKWSMFLWFPYYFIMSYSFRSLFPLGPGETMFPIFGLVIIAGMLFYPFFIRLIQVSAESRTSV
ncbi:hypothetical protein [Cytobacillus gottheilii]|uniref:hypothetical protein n=1 Tax=Cytobacillus gottheilii TaxID=859144 RepID=UPI0009BA3ABC|nr:hypothetical protein [Cytobacillus gottheilii]